ncbi:hypothetical protein BGZ82_004320, partial [Podila clonocystis]
MQSPNEDQHRDCDKQRVFAANMRTLYNAAVHVSRDNPEYMRILNPFASASNRFTTSSSHFAASSNRLVALSSHPAALTADLQATTHAQANVERGHIRVLEDKTAHFSNVKLPASSRGSGTKKTDRSLESVDTLKTDG